MNRLTRLWTRFRSLPPPIRFGCWLGLGFFLMLAWPRPAVGEAIYLTGDALQSEIARCEAGGGCVSFTRAESDQMRAAFAELLRQAMEMGRATERASCLSQVHG